jgi:hypothetical protein
VAERPNILLIDPGCTAVRGELAAMIASRPHDALAVELPQVGMA